MQISHKSLGCKHPSKRAARCRHTWWHNDHLETNKQLHSTKAIAPFHKRCAPPSLSLSLFPLPSPICHKFILPHLTSPLVLVPELPINHCCCLTLSIFPETQGGCCRNWVRHNLQGSRAWLVMIPLGNVAISTQGEIGGMGGRGWVGGGGGGGVSLYMMWHPRKAGKWHGFIASHQQQDICVCVCVCVCLCLCVCVLSVYMHWIVMKESILTTWGDFLCSTRFLK